VDEVLRDGPAIALLSGNRTLFRNNMSLDGITTGKVLAAVWARVGLLDQRRVMREKMTLQVMLP